MKNIIYGFYYYYYSVTLNNNNNKGVDGGNKWRAVRGRPRLGWMDGVKVALGNRGMTGGSAKDRKD